MAAGDLIYAASQIEWDEALLLGDETEIVVTGLTGWEEMPPVDSGNVPRPSWHGSWSGRPITQERIVTVEFDLLPISQDTTALINLIKSATPLGLDGTERALVVKSDDGQPLVAWGQVIRRALPMAPGYRRRVQGCAIQWACSDPRRYHLQVETLHIQAPLIFSTGYDYPLQYPINYGVVVGTVGDGVAVNSGDAPTHPIITILGPAVRPRVVNLITQEQIEFDIELVAGEQLVIDTQLGTVTLSGGSRTSALTGLSVPVESFFLPPGATPLAFRAQSFPTDGALLSVAWRSASW